MKLKDLLKHYEQDFWDSWNQLKPKDKCDIYIRMLPYAYARVPEEKPLDEAGKQRMILEETTRKATIIGQGLPPADDFDEE